MFTKSLAAAFIAVIFWLTGLSGKEAWAMGEEPPPDEESTNEVPAPEPTAEVGEVTP